MGGSDTTVASVAAAGGMLQGVASLRNVDVRCHSPRGTSKIQKGLRARKPAKAPKEEMKTAGREPLDRQIYDNHKCN
jgi:hypothetical protein